VKRSARYDTWWSSALLIGELRRLAEREGLADPAEEMLAEVELVAIDRSTLERASRLPPMTVRTLDAIHLEAAVGEIDLVLTYDRQLQEDALLMACASRRRSPPDDWRNAPGRTYGYRLSLPVQVVRSLPSGIERPIRSSMTSLAPP
jgi:PIN domain-containing protein